MSREIRYRIYCKDQKKYLSGDFSIGCQTGEIRGKYGEKFNNLIAEQYIGIKDKNGIKCFEGDKLKDEGLEDYEFYLIYYNEEFCDFRIDLYVYLIDGETINKNRCELYTENYISPYFLEQMEIIGNIHDNPELLKQ